MPSSWYQRFWLVLFVVLGSLYVLLPTFLWGTEDATTTEAVTAISPEVPETVGTVTTGAEISAAPAAVTDTAAEVAAVPAGEDSTGDGAKEKDRSGLQALFPEKRLNLGLDLVGGSHLVLSVDSEETIRSRVNGNRRTLRDHLKEEGIPFEDIRQPLGTAELQIILERPQDRDALQDLVEKAIGTQFEEKTFQTHEDKGLASYAYEANAVQNIQEQAVSQVLELLRSRINAFGAREPILYRERANRIVVQLPGVKDPAFAIQEIKRTARLEFHIVDEEWYRQQGSEEELQALVQQALAANPTADELRLNQYLHAQGAIPEESAVYFEERYVDPKTNELVRAKPLLLKREVVLTGDRLTDAFPITDQFNNWQVSLKFDSEGAEQFASLTGENTNHRMAIVLEGVVESAPNINEKIEGGNAVITLGVRDKQQQAREASEIARVLRTGALPAPVRIEQNRTVGPSLGQDAIDKGVRASAVGISLVVLFAWFWYRWSGVIATITLLANGIVLLGLMTLFDATLTLPGIAGLILTLGMAIDANVLIFERIREELRLGKTARISVDSGFEKAFSSILDGNMTTAAAGIVLYAYGTDQIKGFAIVLLLGIATTLFCALVITRLLMDYYTIKIRPSQLSI